MGGLFQTSKKDRDWQAYAAPPPPPRPVVLRPVPDAAPTSRNSDREPIFDAGHAPTDKGHPFDASLEICEVDDRDQPGAPWPARGRTLSRSALTFRTRRMCYEGRRLLVAVHMIDDKPVLLFGHVARCDYQGAGQYLVDLQLAPIPDRHELRTWLGSRG